MDKSLKPAGFYGRVSGDDEESIESQLAFCRQRAAEDGYYIPNVFGFQFSDVYVKGTTDNRPGLDALDRMICAGKTAPFDRVYVRDVKRLGRWKDPRKHDYYAVKWEKEGVWIRYADKAEHVTYSEGVKDSDVGRYVIDKVDHVQTSRDRTEIESRLFNARRTRLIKGFLPGGRPPYGLVRVLVHKESREVLRVLEPGESTQIEGYRASFRCGDESELKVVRFIFDGVEAGRSYDALATDLNERKVPPPGTLWTRNARSRGATDLKWYSGSVGKIVKNEIYTGVLTYGNREQGPPVTPDAAKLGSSVPVRYESFYPDPPITREQFDRVQAIVAGRNTLWKKRRATRPKFLLTGKIRCPLCTCIIGGRRQKARHPGGREYQWYFHENYRKRGQKDACPHMYKNVPMALIDDVVLTQLRTLLSDPALAEMVRAEMRQLLGPEASDSRKDRRAQIGREITTAIARLDRIQELLIPAKSGVARERFQSKHDATELEIERLRRELSAAEEGDTHIRDALNREVWLAVNAAELLKLVDGPSFEMRRDLVLRVLEYLEYDFGSGLLTLAVRVA